MPTHSTGRPPIPAIASAAGATVRAGFTTGEATLTVRSGEAAASLVADVAEARGPPLTLTARRSLLKVGMTEQLHLETAFGITANWTSSNPAVLEPLRDGVFYARAVGKAEACAKADFRIACRQIQVVR
jgi:hypothetical protein